MTRFLRLLLRLYPPAFRERFGDELMGQAADEIRRGRRDGRWSGAVAWVRTTVDLVSEGLDERVRPTWPADGRRARGGPGMTTTMTTTTGETMNMWMRELKMAARTLGRTPGFTLATVGTLALALGANAALFAAADAVVFDPLPFEEPDRLVHIAASAPGSDLPDEFGVSAEFYLQYRDRSDELESLAVVNSFTATMRVGERVERVRLSQPTPSLFEVLRVEPMLGRIPGPDEEDRAILSHAAWLEWFGGDPAVLGQSHYMLDGPRTIVAVMPPEFRFPDNGTLVWLPIEADASAGEIEVGNFGMGLVGRLAPGADHASLERELATLAARLPERFGGSASYRRIIERHVPVVRSLEDEVFAEIGAAVTILLVAMGIVLLVACANVANLFAVRAEGRGREFAVRTALGAGRRGLVRTQMAEAVLVAALAGGLALVFAILVLPALTAGVPSFVPGLRHATLTPLALILTGAATAGAALLCGGVPAWRASRPRLERLRDGTRGNSGRRATGRSLLVAAQTALALVLLIGSGLLLRSFDALRQVDPGYETADRFTTQFAPERDGLADGPAWQAFHLEMLDRLAALPGVRSVGIVENLPLDESLDETEFVAVERFGDPEATRRLMPSYVGGDYFGTMEISVVQGRALAEADLAGTPVAVVSQRAAEMMWPGQDPMGRQLRTLTNERAFTVVGVAEDIRQDDFRDPPAPIVYLPMIGPEHAWFATSPAYVIHTPRAAEITPEVRAVVREMAPEAPMYRTYTMATLASRSMSDLTFTMTALALAAGMALLLGAVGLFGTLSYVVSRRTREIGVRLALGAEAGEVQRMVVARGTRIVALGVAGGLLVSLLASRALQGLLFGVRPADPVTFVVMPLAMLAVGALASWLPARRAAAVAPVESMRAE